VRPGMQHQEREIQLRGELDLLHERLDRAPAVGPQGLLKR
jgi:hypothetical protein